MISVVGRSANLAASLKASNQVVASGLKAVTQATLPKEVLVLKSPNCEASNPSAYCGSLPTGPLQISSGIGVGLQVRYAHTDLQFPSFDDVRRTKTIDPTAKTKESQESRQGFTYLVTGGSLIMGAYAAKVMVRQAVSSVSATADVLALAKIEIKTGDIPEGKNMTFKWRGKPVFVRHRTDEEIATEQSVDVGSLRDPQHDNDRVKDPKWLVVVGVCTHLGCVPIADAGDFGGYYCPCHGSHYDASGRIRKGPAPQNLEVPDYEFPEPGLLIVG